MNEFPPDGYIDEQDSPPDGYADVPAVSAPKEPSLLDRGINTYKKIDQYSPMNILTKKGPEAAKALFQMGGEKLAEGLAGGPLKNYPKTSAGIGTTIAMIPDAVESLGGGLMSETKPSLNMLQKLGGQGVNKSIGIDPNTLKILSKSENPSLFGSKLGSQLNKEGVVGYSAESTYDNVVKMKDKFGKAVGEAIQKIKSAGHPTSVEAESALKPLVDEWARRGDTVFSATKQTAKPFEQAYSRLSELAKNNNGKLSIDDIQAVIDETGEAMGNATAGSTKHSAYSKLYGQLAKVREGIVEKIAGSVKDPSLEKNFKEANKGFSRYATIFRDVAKKARAEGSGKGFSLSNLDVTKPASLLPQSVQTAASKAILGTGNMAKGAAKHIPGAVYSAGKLVKQLVQNGHVYKWNGETYE